MEAKGNSPTLLVGVQMAAGTIKISKEVPYQINIQKPHGPNLNPTFVLQSRKSQNSQLPMNTCLQGSSTDNGQARMVAGHDLGFLFLGKPNKYYRDRVWRKYQGGFYSQASREGKTVGSCLKNCAPHPTYEESKGLYMARTHSQELVMRNKGNRISFSSSRIFSKTVTDWSQ